MVKNDATFNILLGVGVLVAGALLYHLLKKQQTIQQTPTEYQTLSSSSQKQLEIIARNAAKQEYELRYLAPTTVPVKSATNALSPTISGAYKNNESWQFKRSPDQTVVVGDTKITVPGRLQSIEVTRNAKNTP